MDMKERILDGALELFSRYGQSRVRMEEIAAYLNISKKTIYNHFKNKTALYHEVMHFYAVRLVENLQRFAEDTETGFATKLNNLLTYGYREIGRKDSPFFEDLGQLNPHLEASPMQFIRSNMVGIINTYVEDAKKEGIIRKDMDTKGVTYVFLNITSGIISWELTDQLPISRVEILKLTIKITLEGLLTDRGKDVLKETLDE